MRCIGLPRLSQLYVWALSGRHSTRPCWSARNSTRTAGRLPHILLPSSGASSRETVTAAGIHTQTLSRLVRAGELERMAPGQYRLPNAPVTEHHGLAIVASAAPRTVACLLSALNFHGIGTQLPHAVWIAVDRRARRPTLLYPPLRMARRVSRARDSRCASRSTAQHGLAAWWSVAARSRPRLGAASTNQFAGKVEPPSMSDSADEPSLRGWPLTICPRAIHPTARTVRAGLPPNRRGLRRGPRLWDRFRAG
ncbi:MAG: type IV toxin-antitoxin system AbiEi family antitoxin domain-containing protein [Steroidobacteraceae bacterium]